MNKSKISVFTRTALLVAIIVIMSFTPLGYLKAGALSITFLTIPVMIGAVTMGPGVGALLGFAFGLTSFLQAMWGTSPLGALMFSVNPILTGVTCIIPRILVGFLCGLIFKALRKIDGKRFWTFIVASFSAPVLNTILFMTSLLACFWNTIIQTDAGMKIYAVTGNNFVLFICLFVGVNAIVEAIACTIIGTAISKPLLTVLEKGSEA